MKLIKQTSLSDIVLEMSPLSEDKEGKLRGGFVGMAGMAGTNGANTNCTCENENCENTSCVNSDCSNTGKCKNIGKCINNSSSGTASPTSTYIVNVLSKGGLLI